LKADRPAEAEQAELIVRLANDAIAQARAMARGLCPVQLERVGLFSALEDLSYQSQLLFGASCRFRTRGSPPACEHVIAMHLYRITQEAIHNAVRHGGASQINIALISRGHRHRLIITDNGRGFDPGARRAAPGGGLRLMNYRATVIGATFSLRSSRGRGTRVACSFTTSFHEKESRISDGQGEHATQAPDLARG
jgi:signal transduction histidine kinase